MAGERYSKINKYSYHRISVKMSHPPSDQYNVEKVINVHGLNIEHAKENAKMYFIKLGYDVHHINYLSIM